MKFANGLEKELKKEGINFNVHQRVLDISSADIIQLNREIEQMVNSDRTMLSTSRKNAARFVCR